jgi:ParB/RepB/Spo0J family partition protein
MTHRAAQLIPIQKVVLGQEHLRRKVKKSEIDRMKLSIRSNRQLAPILLRAVGDHFEVIYGALRLLGAKEAGETLIWAEIADRELTAADIIKLQFCENEHRLPLNPIESAFGVCRFIEETGLSQTETAVELCISDTEVSRCWERINDWSDELRRAVQEGKVCASTAHEIHHDILSPEEQLEAIRVAAKGELKRDDVKSFTKRKRAKPNATAESASPPNSAEISETPVATHKRGGRMFKSVVGDGSVLLSHRDLSPKRVSAMLHALASRAQELCEAGVDREAFFEAMREVSLEPVAAAL